MHVCVIPPSILPKIAARRSEIYAQDGVTISSDTAHHWHIAATDRSGDPVGGLRMRLHERPSFDDLELSKSAPHARAEVEAVLSDAADAGLSIAEIGGLWVSPECRGMQIPRRLVTQVRAITDGQAVGLATATARHRSAALLKRLGGERLVAPYFDPAYGCAMELLKFRPAGI